MGCAIVQCLVFTILLCGHLATSENVVDYKNYRIIEVAGVTDFTNERFLFTELGISDDEEMDILHENAIEGKVQVLVKPQHASTVYRNLKEKRMTFKVITEDLGGDIFNYNLNVQTRVGDLTGGITFERFMNLEEIYAYLDTIAAQFSDRVSVQTIGITDEGRDIKMVVISNAVCRKMKRSSIPVVFIEAGIHAREWAAPASVLYFIDQLLNAPSANPALQNIEWQIVPVTNPDGYEFSWTNDRLWRKNRHINSGSYCIGVDLNRNFATYFGGAGTSINRCSQIYKGTSAFSEQESKAIRDAVNEVKLRIQAYVAVHTYGQYILYPPGVKNVNNVSDADLARMLDTVSGEMAAAIFNQMNTRYRYGISSEVLYAAAGTSEDWAYVDAGIPLAYTFELRPDSFDPGFLLNPSDIVATSQDFLTAMRVLSSHVSPTKAAVKTN